MSERRISYQVERASVGMAAEAVDLLAEAQPLLHGIGEVPVPGQNHSTASESGANAALRRQTEFNPLCFGVSGQLFFLVCRGFYLYEFDRETVGVAQVAGQYLASDAAFEDDRLRNDFDAGLK
jgi:hypothetical protein